MSFFAWNMEGEVGGHLPGLSRTSMVLPFYSPEEQWNPGKSTLLQVLISIQSMILNDVPYFNEYVTSVDRSKDYAKHIHLGLDMARQIPMQLQASRTTRISRRRR